MEKEIKLLKELLWNKKFVYSAFLIYVHRNIPKLWLIKLIITSFIDFIENLSFHYRYGKIRIENTKPGENILSCYSPALFENIITVLYMIEQPCA